MRNLFFHYAIAHIPTECTGASRREMTCERSANTHQIHVSTLKRPWTAAEINPASQVCLDDSSTANIGRGHWPLMASGHLDGHMRFAPSKTVWVVVLGWRLSGVRAATAEFVQGLKAGFFRRVDCVELLGPERSCHLVKTTETLVCPSAGSDQILARSS